MVPIEAHLVLNHVPLIGLIFGLVFFLGGLRRSSQAAIFAGLRIFVAMGVVVLLVVGSGLVTENLLADTAWIDADALSMHRQVGFLTLVVLVGLAGFSGAMLFASRTTRVVSAWARTTIVGLAIAGVAAGMWAAYLGGALRHTELGRSHPVSTSRQMRQISMCSERVWTAPMCSEEPRPSRRISAPSVFPSPLDGTTSEVYVSAAHSSFGTVPAREAESAVSDSRRISECPS